MTWEQPDRQSIPAAPEGYRFRVSVSGSEVVLYFEKSYVWTEWGFKKFKLHKFENVGWSTANWKSTSVTAFDNVWAVGAAHTMLDEFAAKNAMLAKAALINSQLHNGDDLR